MVHSHIVRAIGAVASAGALHAQGRGFEPLIAHQKNPAPGPRLRPGALLDERTYVPIIIKNPTSAPDGASGEKPARSFGRAADQTRPVTLTPGVIKNASGSCMAEFGDTRVLCCATVEECVPRWRKGQGAGWVTAEYAMLPASTNHRTPREYKGRKGRSMEIERLIGRSLRAVCRLDKLAEYTITLDCDVIQADGGTRTASVTGAWVALHDALMGLVDAGKLPRLPLTGQVAAVSCGIVGGQPLLDLDYPEDSHADVDLNLVCTDAGGIVEVQGTGERSTLSRAELDALLDMGQAGVAHLIEIQNQVTGFRS